MQINSAYLLTNSEVRKEAREKLKGNWGTAIGAFVVYSLIVFAISIIPIIGTITLLLITGAFTLGLAILYLNLVKYGSADFSDLFKGFNQFGKALGASLLMYLFIFLWSLLLIIPGIIASIRYSQTFYILAENPDMKVTEAINLSKKMMAGVKWKYFMLTLSFIGWALLSLLTFGIGYLWLIPYVYTSLAVFHTDLTRSYNGEITEN